MKLTWQSSDGENAHTRARYPVGYWYAATDNGGYDGVGPDPLTALAELVNAMETALAEH